jgi:hypothetical protein
MASLDHAPGANLGYGPALANAVPGEPEAEAMPPLEQASPAGEFMWQSAPSLAPFGGSSQQDGGGGGPFTSASNGSNPSISSTRTPPTPGTPAAPGQAANASGGPATTSNDLGALAHGLAQPSSSGKSPPTAGPLLGPLTDQYPPRWTAGSPTYTWTQTPTPPPTVTNPGNQTSAENSSVSQQISASDPNNYPLTYNAVNLPLGLSINSTSGLISGTVDYNAFENFQAGSYSTSVIVANNHGGSTTVAFTWSITDVDRAPTVTNPGAQTNAQNDSVSLQISASDLDGDTLSYTASNLPPGLSMNGTTGLISGTVATTAAAGSTYSVTVTASDQTLSANQTFTWTITIANHAPQLTSPGNQTNAAGDAVSLPVSASDADGNTLSYTASGLPAGLSVDPSSGTISGTIANSAASSTPYNVTVTVSDGMANASQSFTWTVNYVGLVKPLDQSNVDGDTVSLQMIASDSAGLTLTYSATSLPSGLSIGSSTGLISGTLTNTAHTNSPYSVTVTASDGTHSASQTFNWTVARLSVPNPGNLSNLEGTTVSLQITATDSGGTPSYSSTNLPTGLSINSSTGLISGTIGTAAHGSSPYTVTVTATDGTNSASQTFMWTVTPRVALVNPGAISNAAGDVVSLQIQASTVGGTLSYTASGLPSGLSISSSSGLISGTMSSSAASATPYAVTVTANDGTSTSSQTFYWTVSTVWEPVTSDQSNYDGDVVSLSAAAHYHSTGTLSYSATGLPSGLSINSSTGLISGTVGSTADTSSPYTVTLTATDGTYTNSATFTWRVSPRVSVTAPNNQTNAAGDVVSLPVTATDALNSTLTYSATSLPTGLSINSSTGVISGTISVGADASSPYTTTVTAADSVVSASATFTWTVTHVSLVNPGPQYSADGQAVSLALSGHDSDGDTVTYSASGLPSGLSISSSSGVISGTLGSTDHTSSPNFVTVTGSDSSHSTSQQFLWYVAQVGVTNPGSQTNQEGSSVSLQISATGSSLTYTAGNLPPGLSISSSTGLISGTLAVGSAATGPYTTTVTASNGTLSSSQMFTWTVTPKVSVKAPAAQTNVEGNTVSLQIQASEPGATLTYSASDLPTGVIISSSTGLISGAIAAGASANSVYDVTVTVSDGTYSTSQIFAWTVTHGNDHAPVLTNPGTQANVIGDSVVLPLTATDSDNDTLSFTATGLPDGLSIDTFSGAITGTPAIDSVASTPHAVTVTVNDGNGGTTSQTFNWVVTDPPFTLQASSFNTTEGALASGVTVATFTNTNPPTPGSNYLAPITWGDGTSSSGTITPSGTTETVTGSHTYDHAGTFSVGVALTDSNGAQSSTTSTATVAAAALTAIGGFSDTAVASSSATLTLATFTDANPNDAANTYTATISWGDNTANSTGTITGNNGSFTVTGAHTYTGTGTYTATITITDADNTSTSTTSTRSTQGRYSRVSTPMWLSRRSPQATRMPKPATSRPRLIGATAREPIPPRPFPGHGRTSR